MNDIENKVIEWHKSTFPRATVQAITDKMNEEISEFMISWDHGDAKEFEQEFADMCIVFMAGQMRSKGKSLTQLISEKLEINKSRVWGEETKNGDRPRER